jgi:hypothetical protein
MRPSVRGRMPLLDWLCSIRPVRVPGKDLKPVNLDGSIRLRACRANPFLEFGMDKPSGQTLGNLRTSQAPGRADPSDFALVPSTLPALSISANSTCSVDVAIIRVQYYSLVSPWTSETLSLVS